MTRSPTVTVVRALGATDVGLVRKANEDAFVVAELGEARRWMGGAALEAVTSSGGVLLAVSDGMGGANAGDVASALSVESLLEGMIAEAHRRQLDGNVLREVIERASHRVHEAAKQPNRHGMGATMTAIILAGATAYIAQIGDSRAYLIRGDRMGQVTHDQSYVQMLVDAGVMTPEDAENSPQKNVILQAMGQETVRVALGRIDLKRGDRLLLCSDGLTNVVDEASIARHARTRDLAAAANELVAKTRAGGAPDNVTVVLAEIA